MADAGDEPEFVCVIGLDTSCTCLKGVVQGFQELLACACPGKTAVLCANCAGKIGCFRCSRCDKKSSVRYCGRACQEAHWGKHRLECAGIMRV